MQVKDKREIRRGKSRGCMEVREEFFFDPKTKIEGREVLTGESTKYQLFRIHRQTNSPMRRAVSHLMSEPGKDSGKLFLIFIFFTKMKFHKCNSLIA